MIDFDELSEKQEDLFATEPHEVLKEPSVNERVPKYDLLEPGTTVESGDEYYAPAVDKWRLVAPHWAGKEFDPELSAPVRRLQESYHELTAEAYFILQDALRYAQRNPLAVSVMAYDRNYVNAVKDLYHLVAEAREQLADEPFLGDLEEPFLHFPEGTDFDLITAWFDEKLQVAVPFLQYPQTHHPILGARKTDLKLFLAQISSESQGLQHAIAAFATEPDDISGEIESYFEGLLGRDDVEGYEISVIEDDFDPVARAQEVLYTEDGEVVGRLVEENPAFGIAENYTKETEIPLAEAGTAREAEMIAEAVATALPGDASVSKAAESEAESATEE